MPRKLIVYGKYFLVIFLFSFLIWQYFTSLKKTSFHLDEHEFIRKSYFYDLFLDRNFKDPRWWDIENAPAQPKLGPYIYGFTLHSYKIEDLSKKLAKAGFNKEKEDCEGWWFQYWGEGFDNFPQELDLAIKYIVYGRKTSVFLGLIGLVFLFLAALKFKIGLLFPVTATFILSQNRKFFEFLTRAMTDSMQLTTFFINIFLVLVFLNLLKRKKNYWFLVISFLMGVNAAFGMGVKVTGIMIVIFLLLLSIVLFLLKSFNKKRIFFSLFAFLITFFSLFYILNPYLYQKPLVNFVDMFAFRLEVAGGSYWREFPLSAVKSRPQAAGLIIGRTLFPSATHTNFKLGVLPIDLAFFLAGFYFMWEKANRFLIKKKITPEFVFVLWTLLVVSSEIFYLRNDWPRYYLPVVASFTVIEAYGIVYLIKCFLFDFLSLSRKEFFR